MGMQRTGFLRISFLVAFGAVVSLAVLLSGCGGAPEPVITVAPSTPSPVVASSTPTAAASATSIASPAVQTAAPTPSPQPPATATLTPSSTATSTSRPVARFVPTPTPGATASPIRPPAAPPAPVTKVTPARPNPIQERIWDPRLTQRGAQLIPAQVQPGQGYWRLVQAQWFDVQDPPFGGQHHIFLDALDQSGKRQTGVRMQMTSLDSKENYGAITTEAKPGEAYAASFSMYIVAPAYRVEPADGAPADAVTGLGLGSIAVPELPMLTSYGFTWRWTVVGQGIPTATPIAAGADPAAALAAPAGPQRLGAGQRIWYAFRYAGGGSPILIRMGVAPPGAASFSVWTPDDVQRWSYGDPERPVGRGAPHPAASGDLIWAGSFSASGVYYVAVDQTGAYAGTFTLGVSGDGVSPAGSGR